MRTKFEDTYIEMMFKKRNVKNSRKSRIRKESKESDNESENIEIVKNERTKRHENPNVQECCVLVDYMCIEK